MKFLTASSFVLSALLLGFSQIPARGFTLDAFTSFDANENPIEQTVELSSSSGETDTDQLTHINLDPSTVFGGKREIKITKDDPDRGSILFGAFKVEEDGEADPF